MRELVTATVSPEKGRKLIAANEHTFFPTNFNFLKSNYGLRPGKLTVFLGTTGSGKSTLIRSIINETAATANVMLILTEEKEQDHHLMQAYNKTPPEITDNITILTESTLSSDQIHTTQQYISEMKQYIQKYKPFCIFIDNITTSSFYPVKSIDTQEYLIKWWKDYASEKGFALIMVAHTSANVSDNHDRFIKDTEVRGSKAITMMAEYLYAFQRYHREGRIYPFVNVLKSRNHRNVGVYPLVYDTGKSIYVSDQKVLYADFIKAFKLKEKI